MAGLSPTLSVGRLYTHNLFPGPNCFVPNSTHSICRGRGGGLLLIRVAINCCQKTEIYFTSTAVVPPQFSAAGNKYCRPDRCCVRPSLKGTRVVAAPGCGSSVHGTAPSAGSQSTEGRFLRGTTPYPQCSGWIDNAYKHCDVLI